MIQIPVDLAFLAFLDKPDTVRLYGRLVVTQSYPAKALPFMWGLHIPNVLFPLFAQPAFLSYIKARALQRTFCRVTPN